MKSNPELHDIAIRLLLEKADRNLEQAQKNSELGYWDLVANRLYYSIFHAVTALLSSDGIKTATHKGTSSQFGKYYVLTGKFSKEDGILYSRLQTMREKADYQNTFSLSAEEGSELIIRTKALLAKLKDAVSEH